MPTSAFPYCALAFDTSAYTTSVALVNAAGEVLHEARQVLKVPSGQRGLRQSEALFQHIVNLPDLMQQIESSLQRHRPSVVAASVAPRNLPDSYMPVFRAGYTVARSVAAGLGVPFLPLSHQEGHLWAAFLALREIPEAGEPFLAVHVSGGTTEALVGTMQENGRIALDIAGETGDLTAGKFVDRVGVALELPFPAGAELERLAASCDGGPIPQVRPAVQGTAISFSGPLTALERQMKDHSAGSIAHAAQQVMADGLARWAGNVVQSAFSQVPRRAYWVGGVAANSTLRATVTQQLQDLGVQEVLFAPPSYSTDNALGVAYYAATQAAQTLSQG